MMLPLPFPSDPICVQYCVAHVYMHTESEYSEVPRARNISTFTSLPSNKNIYFGGFVCEYFRLCVSVYL